MKTTELKTYVDFNIEAEDFIERVEIPHTLTVVHADDDLPQYDEETQTITIKKLIAPQPTPAPTPTPTPTAFPFGQPAQIPRPWRHVYSQLQAFRSDDEIMLVCNIDTGRYGSFSVKFVSMISAWGSEIQSPRWYNDNIVYINRGTNSICIMGSEDLVGKDVYKHPNPLSESITYEDITGDVITCYDKTTRKLFDVHLVTGVKTDWPAFTAVMGTDVDWATSYYGTRCAMMRGANKGLYHFTGAGWVRSTDHTRHGDLGMEDNGQPFYFCEKWYAGSGTGDVSLWKDYLNPINKDMNTAINTGWGRSEWISLCGPADTALMTASNEYTNNPDTRGKIWKLNINTGAKTIICDHGSADWGNYWNQPHATLSKSGKLAAFASNRSGQTYGYIVGCSP